jgi:hypothetical protein
MKQGGRNMSKERERETKHKSKKKLPILNGDDDRSGTVACRGRREESGDDGSISSSAWVRERERGRESKIEEAEKGGEDE